MMTMSGKVLKLDGGDVPTLHDVAYGLSRMCRFGAQTAFDWTVAHHLLLCDAIAKDWGYTNRGRQLVLLHDVHEVWTGDIPTDCKTEDLIAAQDMIDERLYLRWQIPRATYPERRAVHEVDRVALHSEARVVAPEHTCRAILGESGAAWKVELVSPLLELPPAFARRQLYHRMMEAFPHAEA